MPDVHEDIAQAETLPPEAFHSREWLERELATIFRSSWLLVPERASSELRDDARSVADLAARRGSRAPFSLLDRPLFLQRDWEGALRAFPNVCTHAWHTLVQGPERQRTITCPQHGRQFECDGKFLSQPGFEKSPSFPREADHLAAFPVAEWRRFLFVALGASRVALEEALAPVTESVSKLRFEEWPRRALAGEAREVPGNWKHHAWNYMDSLHIPYVHRKPGGLADALDLASYRTELYDHAALQWAYAKDPAAGFDPALLPDRFRDPAGRRVLALWWLVWPNVTLNFYPWGLSVNVYQPVPARPDRTLFLWYHFVADEAKYVKRDEIWFLKDVDAEDVDAVSQVARGVASGFAVRGRFAAGAEAGPHWFHRKVAQAVLSGPNGR